MRALRHWVAPHAATAAFLGTAAAGAVFAAVLAHLEREVPIGLAVSITVMAALLAAFGTGWFVERRVGRRMRLLNAFLEQRASVDGLERLPPLGSDEVGKAAANVNRLLADMTSYRANLLDQGRQLDDAREELRLKAALAEKSKELETRLAERAVLFDILRVSASQTGLDDVLAVLVERLRAALRLREVAILIKDDADRFVVRAVRGFAAPDAVLRRSIALGEGLAGEVARSRDVRIVPDVRQEPRYLAFWGEAPREGSCAAAPITHGENRLGLLVMTRPTDDPLLESEVRFLGAVADQLALAIRHAQLIEELRELSLHDELTGLANRRLLSSQLSRELERARRFEAPLSVLAVDIDHFKQLNDRCGHAVGDDALKGVAEVLRRNVRSVDTVARVGGEEFAVLLPRTQLAEAIAVAEKLRQRVCNARLPGGEGQPAGRITLSVGVAVYRPADDARSLLARADDALYLAKNRGRNRVAWHEPPPRDADAPADQTLH